MIFCSCADYTEYWTCYGSHIQFLHITVSFSGDLFSNEPSTKLVRIIVLRVSVGSWSVGNGSPVVLLRYGPCQTPTLGFCVERHIRITTFVPEPFWVVRPHISKGGHQLMLEWDRSRLFDREVFSVCLSLSKSHRCYILVDPRLLQVRFLS